MQQSIIMMVNMTQNEHMLKQRKPFFGQSSVCINYKMYYKDQYKLLSNVFDKSF